MKRPSKIKTFEEFKKDPTTLVQEAFLEIKNKIEEWFKSGALSNEKDVNLESIDVLTNTTQPFLTFEFSAPENYFEITIKGDLQNMTQTEEPKNFLMEIKKFSTESMHMIDRQEEELEEGEFTEDYLIQKIAKT